MHTGDRPHVNNYWGIFYKHCITPPKILLDLVHLKKNDRCICISRSVRSWCDGLLDRSFMVDPLSYLSFQPVDSKGCGMCYPVCGMRERFFFLTTHSTHFIYGYMTSDIWLRTILIVRKETRCRHIGYSYRLTARVLLYAPSHRQDNTSHYLCYTSRGALAGTRNSSMGLPHEGSIRRPTAPWANALPLRYVPRHLWNDAYKRTLDANLKE